MPQQPSLAAIILAAGAGTRMRSALPKVLHPLAGRPMLAHVAAAVAELAPERVVVVVAAGQDHVAEAAPAAVAAVQDPPLGTAHAVLAAAPAMAGLVPETVLILYGDTPLVRSETLAAMLRARAAGAGGVVLGFRPQDPAAYGRLIRDPAGNLEKIVEHRDASAAERAVGLCNSGVMAVDGRQLFALLREVGNANAKGEYYLTDIVALARGRGLAAAVVEASAEEVMGVNSRAELAAAEAALQGRLRAKAMAEGVGMIDPATVWLSWDTRFSRDVVVEPNVWFGPGVSIGEGARIRAFCHLEAANVEAGAEVGPFARLRPGASIGPGAHVGNFVEVKNSRLEAGAKANHLSYLGDAHVGSKANIGAGTITCNYDGFGKYRTEIGADAFIGSNSALVAPVSIGQGAVIGAGSTISRDVEAGALAVSRAEQRELRGAAETFRARARARKRRATGRS